MLRYVSAALALAVLPFTGAGGAPMPELPGGAARELPDLVPLPVEDVEIDTGDQPYTVQDTVLDMAGVVDHGPADPRVLRFATLIANRSQFSIDLVGRPTVDQRSRAVRMEALQCTRFEGPPLGGADRRCSRFEPVGTLSYHAHHGHFHLDDFARYELRRDAGGRPMYGPGSVVARSVKVGFCLADTEAPEGGGARAWYAECQTTPHVPVTARMGISPGWGDAYGANLPGQQISLRGVPDGTYWISVTINPADGPAKLNLRETSRANNTAHRRVVIKGNTVTAP